MSVERVQAAVSRVLHRNRLGQCLLIVTDEDAEEIALAAVAAMPPTAFLTSSTAKITIVGNAPTTGGYHAG